MLEDIDLLRELTGKETRHSGIAYFVPEQEREYNIAWATKMKNGKWVNHNWEYTRKVNPSMDNVGKQIASYDGIILEIGTGPGGGYMPYILKANPDATIIISDLSPTVISEWKNFLDKTVDSPNLYYAVFDFCAMPFKNNSIDIISDGGGIGNCDGEKSQALKEAYRVLKPGGKLITSTGFVNKETLAALPGEVQNVLIEKRPIYLRTCMKIRFLPGLARSTVSLVDVGTPMMMIARLQIWRVHLE